MTDIQTRERHRPGLLVVLVGSDAAAVPSSAFAGMAEITDAVVVRFSTAANAAAWLAEVHGPASSIRVGALEIDREAPVTTWKARPVSLTALEHAVLVALAEAPEYKRTFRELNSSYGATTDLTRRGSRARSVGFAAPLPALPRAARFGVYALSDTSLSSRPRSMAGGGRRQHEHSQHAADGPRHIRTVHNMAAAKLSGRRAVFGCTMAPRMDGIAAAYA